jgi:5'-methylthioadenosine phosphorylase
VSQIAVIAGSGAGRIFQDMVDRNVIDTPYGSVKTYTSDELHPGVPIILRHGEGHKIPPHLVPYRAIIAGLAKIGTERIVGVGAVGSLRSSLRPGDIAFPDQFLDFTRARPSTFVETIGGDTGHIDLTDPFCEDLRRIAIASAGELEIPVHPRATYVCTDGPRYETSAEIRMFKMLGGDLVGMTCVPEVVLAREKRMCYLHLSVITNMAAGIRPEPISHEGVERIIANKTLQVRQLIRRVVRNEAISGRKCQCAGEST